MLKTKFCKLNLNNPTRLASGIMGVNAGQLIRVAKEGAGAVTMKSIGPKERKGHKNPAVIEWNHGLLNAVGLPTPGYKNTEEEFEELKALKKIRVPLIASIYGSKASEFLEVAEYVAGKNPDAIELDISCPHTEWGGTQFACDPEISHKIVSGVKDVAGKIPIIAKLTPAATSPIAVGVACEEAGADAICAANTMPGMIIDVDARKPILAFKKGGMSGPALKPINMKIVYELYGKVKVPIIGEGGITNGKDALEYVMAGATLCGIGSAVYKHGSGVFKKTTKEMEQWLKQNGYSKLSQVRGIAHE
ncbi:MAG: dihydroorotate dehydrogenase B catalytic subunit [Candidatus Diapherotrites archaeon]|uniref:Dihydroorotate dehydrogenase n=1 Tax=Candidatus Iainarchaeum sp. TaxID=3101447 RepID=A0A2D6LPR4_9ARCH|nr:dihydroorotate dehydrogenase B catalytic subunit [Candidatus Diapherotrites archaeon]|tara:strand:- start:1397 stop:2311 length:915 start_codon:yes stop_codon:yes gene_type:complete